MVIFDETSQIPPSEAIGTLARAKQAVVAGGDRQLPPTSFFRSQESEDYDDDSGDGLALIANIEPILDVIKGLLIKEQMLRGTTAAGTASSLPFPTTTSTARP